MPVDVLAPARAEGGAHEVGGAAEGADVMLIGRTPQDLVEELVGTGDARFVK